MYMTKQSKIKILHVAECIGGVDKYLHSLLKYTERNKYETIVVLSHLYNASEYKDISNHIEQLNIPHDIGIKTILSSKKIRSIIKKYDPDVVYAHSSIAGAITRIACLGVKCKVIYNPHGWSFNIKSKKSWIYVALERLMAKYCDAIVCISEAEKKSALDNNISNINKLHIIYNGIETNIVPDKSRKELGIPEDAYVIGMVGRICKQKAPDIFVGISKFISDAYFLIVGDVLEGSYEERKEIEKIAKENNVKLKITGWIDNPIDYVGTFDVACLLSRWEGFGLAIPEYMICKKPIVATNVDALSYLIQNEQNGLLVSVDNQEEAANAISKIRNNDEFRKKIIKKGYKDVFEKYDVKRVALETDKLINALLD